MTDLEQFSRQAKPFIDENLQFQMPALELSNNQMNNGVSQVYCHYIGAQPLIAYQEINENELYYAMQEAENSFLAWRERKEEIIQLSNKY